LFGKPVETAKTRKPRVAHSAKKTMRETTDSIALELTVNDKRVYVAVIRPIHSRDAVWCQYDADMIAAVVQFLRSATFSEQKHQYRTSFSDLPPDVKGIHKRPQGFYVTMPSQKGSRKLVKRADEIMGALASASEQQDAIEGNKAPQDDGSYQGDDPREPSSDHGGDEPLEEARHEQSGAHQAELVISIV
jgi:hypothetical protein